jgi:TolB-like protein/tRNA A-37 threonylcarbamoyl transferase component Bud32
VSLIAGSRVGHYEVIELLGTGGMGRVYRARDLRLQRDVALKVLQIDSPDRRERFQREALAVAALNHPNIVTIYSVEEVEGMPCLTMELVDGQPLRERITAGGMTLDRLLDLAIPIAEAISAAHRTGIVHRDLKPANVMVTRDGRVKVLDFGLAKLTRSADADATTIAATEAGVTLGTVAYMSPEQARGEAVDERADIFSFGAILYEMATGRRLFHGDSAVSVLTAILDGDIPLIGGSYADLDRVIARAVAKKPHQRYKRIEDVHSDLQALRTGSTLRAPAVKGPGPSVAVLPFANMSADADQEYFCDGMAEELISALARIKGLRVASRTSAFQYKGQKVDVRQIGEQLGVKAVLEGSVRKLGNRLRITAQLINVNDGYHIWSDRYDRTLDDVFAIQDEIAAAITGNIEGVFARPRTQLVKRATSNLEAYQLYLRGRYRSYHLTDVAESLLASLQCFQQAAALDPHYAPAHAGIADAYIMLGYYTIVPSSEASSQAYRAAQQAIALDPELPDGYAALGWVKACYGIEIPTAERDLLRAIELGPGNAPAYNYYGVLLFAMGRFDESIAFINESLVRDPSFLVARFSLCHAYVAARRFDEALREIRQLQELAPNWPGIRWYQGLVLGGMRRYDEAIPIMEEGTRMVGGSPLFAGQLALLHALAGHRDVAQTMLNDLLGTGRTSAYIIALVSAALGDLEQAFVNLHRAIDEHNDNVSLMGVDWRFDTMRNDPRFAALLSTLGLPLVTA